MKTSLRINFYEYSGNKNKSKRLVNRPSEQGIKDSRNTFTVTVSRN